MKRYLTTYFLTGMLILALAITFLFFIKNRVQDLSRNIKLLNKQILTEQENTHVLRAEYSYLTNPQRLKKLTDKYLNLQLPKNNQLITQDKIETYLKEFSYNEKMTSSSNPYGPDEPKVEGLN